MDIPPLLFIPGMMLDAGVFAAQIEALSGRFDLVVADITGSDSVEALATSVLAAAPARFGLVGMSMGGIVALEILKRSPHRVSHLALISTTPHADLPERRGVRAAQMTRVGQGYLQDVMRETITSQYLSIGNQSNQELRSQLERTALALGAEVFVRQSLALRDRRDSMRTLRDIRCPTLVLCGREDALCPVAVHEETAAAIITADLTVLSGAGHLAVMERADAVTQALSHLMSRAP